jgi:hypothetical protein
MEYRLSEQELKDLMHRSWLKSKKFYKGQTDDYFYDFFEAETKQLNLYSVTQRSKLFTVQDSREFKEWQKNMGIKRDSNDCYDWNGMKYVRSFFLEKFTEYRNKVNCG